MTPDEIHFFDLLAVRWDDEEIKSTPEKISLVLDAIGVAAGQSVLDLGTGTGVLIRPLLSRIGPQGRLTAIDASGGMLERAIAKHRAEKGVRFVLADFEEQPVEGRYDLIMLYCVYPHLSRPLETLRRLWSDNLNPGGRIAIAFPSDEKFINAIHRRRRNNDLLDSDILAPAPVLAQMLRSASIPAEATDAGDDVYIVIIGRS